MKHEKLHRLTFISAGIYNLAWGLYSGIDPQWLFRFSGLPLLNHPHIFACLGMVVGLYGILHLEVARNPATGFLIGSLGLFGKILGPIGWSYLYLMGEWPFKSIVLILFNDIIWWIPFVTYVLDSKDQYLKTFQRKS